MRFSVQHRPAQKPKGEEKKKENTRTTLDPDAPDEWLTGIIIANILHELDIKYILRPNLPVCVSFLYPMSTFVFNGILQNPDSKQTREMRNRNQVTIIVINTGAHWTVIVIDCRNTKQLFYFDSLGYCIPDFLKTSLIDRFPEFTFINWNYHVQHEGVHCGVWACWFVEVVLNYVCTDRDLTTIDLSQYVYINTSNTRNKHRNTTFIESKRLEYTNWLLEAKLNGCLFYEE